MPVRKPIDIKKGYVVKCGASFYEIVTEEPLKYVYEHGNTAIGYTNTIEMEKLKPNDNYLYWIIEMSIDGLATFQIQMPKGIMRGGPTQSMEQYWDRKDAHPLAPFNFNFFIKPQVPGPAVQILNSSGKVTYTRITFRGYKFYIKVRTDAPQVYTDVTDWSTAGGIL